MKFLEALLQLLATLMSAIRSPLMVLAVAYLESLFTCIFLTTK